MTDVTTITILEDDQVGPVNPIIVPQQKPFNKLFPVADEFARTLYESASGELSVYLHCALLDSEAWDPAARITTGRSINVYGGLRFVVKDKRCLELAFGHPFGLLVVLFFAVEEGELLPSVCVLLERKAFDAWLRPPAKSSPVIPSRDDIAVAQFQDILDSNDSNQATESLLCQTDTYMFAVTSALAYFARQKESPDFEAIFKIQTNKQTHFDSEGSDETDVGSDEELDDEQADGKQAELRGKLADDKPTNSADNLADGKQADSNGKQADDKNADDKNADDKNADDKKADCKKDDGKQANGRQPDDKQTDCKQVGDKQAIGRQPDDKQTDCKQVGDKQANGRQPDDKQTDCKQVGDKKTDDINDKQVKKRSRHDSELEKISRSKRYKQPVSDAPGYNLSQKLLDNQVAAFEGRGKKKKEKVREKTGELKEKKGEKKREKKTRPTKEAAKKEKKTPAKKNRRGNAKANNAPSGTKTATPSQVQPLVNYAGPGTASGAIPPGYYMPWPGGPIYPQTLGYHAGIQSNMMLQGPGVMTANNLNATTGAQAGANVANAGNLNLTKQDDFVADRKARRNTKLNLKVDELKATSFWKQVKLAGSTLNEFRRDANEVDETIPVPQMNQPSMTQGHGGFPYSGPPNLNAAATNQYHYPQVGYNPQMYPGGTPYQQTFSGYIPQLPQHAGTHHQASMSYLPATSLTQSHRDDPSHHRTKPSSRRSHTKDTLKTTTPIAPFDHNLSSQLLHDASGGFNQQIPSGYNPQFPQNGHQWTPGPNYNSLPPQTTIQDPRHNRQSKAPSRQKFTKDENSESGSNDDDCEEDDSEDAEAGSEDDEDFDSNSDEDSGSQSESESESGDSAPEAFNSHKKHKIR